ncbi:MAG: hypothetical protein WBE26_01165 [Phycisphaerae bacterium]
MIEFKAECGHTVRAKDEDAGSVVRCSYCGRKATVPESAENDLDFLFKDIGPPDQAPRGGSRRRRPRLPFFKRRPRRPGQFDPFAIILKMCYAALLLIIVILVVRTLIRHLPDGGKWIHDQVARFWPEDKPKKEEPKDNDSGRGRKRRRGLIHQSCLKGLYVASTPPGATVYYLEASKAPPQGRINLVKECKQKDIGGDGECFSSLGNGSYVVEVVLPVNDPRFNDPNLPYFRKYRALRRKIQEPSSEQGTRLLEEFFLPDGADSVFIDRTEEQSFIVRQFRSVTVHEGRPTSVRALFLPKIVPGGSDRFSIVRLVTDYIPKDEAYAFDEEYVRGELDFYEVPEPDQSFVVKALSRIGVIPYVAPDQRIRLFKIGVDDGVPTAPVIRDARE